MTHVLFKKPLSIHDHIGFIASPRLGDALLSLIVVNNLVRNGYRVTYFSDVIAGFAAWFPELDIQPLPNLADARSTFSSYDLLLHKYRHNMIADVESWHPCVRVLADSLLYKSQQSMVNIQMDICKQELFLKNVVPENGLQAPKNLLLRKNKQEVFIHPSSSQVFRQWLPERFLKVAAFLQKQHYFPHFVVSPDERSQWMAAENAGFSLVTLPLDQLAARIYQSGWFIGNDSGVGHLASNLGIPTLTLCLRKSLARQWAPNWAPRQVVLPPAWLISRPLKEKYWRYAVSVRKVCRAFNRLVGDNIEIK